MSVVMAPLAAAAGRDAIFWLVPLAGAVLVWSAFVIARRLAGGLAGATAAILTATSPIVLFQVVQPMNDVLAAALWMAGLAIVLIDRPKGLSPQVSRGSDPLREPRGDKPLGLSLIAGFVCGLAILVRPNLAPLALVIAAAPLVLKWPQPTRAVVIMAAAALPGLLLLLWLNQQLYGSIVASGYGDAAQLFAVGHIRQNVFNFGRAFLDTQYLVPLLGVAAPFAFTDLERRIAILLLAAVAIVAAIYCLYQPYAEWWYLRFLIPAVVLLVILTAAAGVALASRARVAGLVPIVAVLLAILGTRAAAERQVFELQRLEGRYREAAALVANRLPEHAVVITVWESGSVRFHAGREALMWDSLDPAWLDRAVTWLQERGRQPYFLFERREEPEFRTRFRGHSIYGALDWPPRVDLNRQVRIYDPADRARFLAGEHYPTDIQPRRK
jgi:4-amino-4-deoxy-L-arabinose transferase-like glycosyltransferase